MGHRVVPVEVVWVIGRLWSCVGHRAGDLCRL